MFYANFILSKKGPLARVWLAAHWDKKLTKAHVFETSIDSTVESILQPKVKMALRTSGHLLLGIVRIYSRKAKYLLADCNEAFIKIKMAFRPGVVDLPEENRQAAINTITLPEVFHDFDTSLADLADINLENQFTLNQSRVEEITMKEDLGMISLPAETDGFGDLQFEEREILRDSSHIDTAPLYNPTSNSSKLIPRSQQQQQQQPNTTINPDLSTTTAIEPSLDKEMEFHYTDPVRDDGFGGTIGEGILGDALMSGVGLFDEQPEITAMDTDVQIGGAEDEDDDEHVNKQKQQQQQQQVVSGGPSVLIISNTNNRSVNTVTDQTTLIANDAEAFALEPLDVTTTTGKDTKLKRKRKLLVDEVIKINGNMMRLQIEDTSDIVTTLDLAPPTKKLMLWKETGGVDKLFAMPGRVAGSDSIQRLYIRNLMTRIPDEFADKDNEDSRSCFTNDNVDFIDPPEIPRIEPPRIPAAEKRLIAEQQAILAQKQQSVVVATETPVTDSNVDTTPDLTTPISLLPATLDNPLYQPSTSFADITMATPGPTPSLPASVKRPVASGYDDDYDDDNLFGAGFDSDDDADYDYPIGNEDSLGGATETLNDEDQIFDKSPESPTDTPEGETVDEQEERRWSKRSQQMMHILHRSLDNLDDSTVSMATLTRANNKKQAASKFYTILVLKKLDAIDVAQLTSYGDILINKGTRFNDLLCV